MSEDTEDRKRNGGKQYPPKSGKNSKNHYDSKPSDEKDSGFSRRDDESGPKRSNDNYRGQQNRHNSGQNYQHKNIGTTSYKRWSEHQANPRRRKKEVYNKISRDDILDRYEMSSPPHKEFMEIIEANLQIFVKEPLMPINIEFDDFDVDPDECINSKPNYTPSTQTSNNTQEGQDVEKGKKGFVEWDSGESNDIFNDFDMQKKDAELRGKKPSTRNEEPEPKKASKSEKQRPEEKNEAAEKEKKSEIEPKGEAIKDTKDIDEDEGDYSNIDKVFEEKLKSNQLQFDEGEEDDLLPEELLQKELANQGNEDEAPVWEDFSVDEIKRSADKMEGLFLDTGSRQSPGMYGNDNVKNGSFQNINSRNQGFGETFDDNSTNASNMTPKSGGGGWDPYLSPQQQQQQFMKQNASNYDFQYMNQGLPVNNPNKMAGGVVNKPMMNNPNYYPMPQQMTQS